MKTSQIQIRRGDKIFYIGRQIILTVIDYYLTPNGINDNTLVCIIKAEKNGYTAEATANKFLALDNEEYITVYKNFATK